MVLLDYSLLTSHSILRLDQVLECLLNEASLPVDLQLHDLIVLTGHLLFCLALIYIRMR